MVIGVLSDTHLTTLTESFRRKVESLAAEVDHFFHLGDVVCPEVLDFLNSFPLSVVSGNMDPPEIRSAWPPKRVVQLHGRRFGLAHGWGAPWGLAERILKEFDDVDCVCFGHSHKIFNRRLGPVLVFNPGAAREGFGSRGTYGRLFLSQDGVVGEHFEF